MTSSDRSLEFEIEVEGDPEAVWQAIATGPGISSWYVPHTVEEHENGNAVARFGPGMEAPGRVAAWDPPRRIVFDGGEDAGGLAFEWTIEAKDGGSCIVRLVNTGFGSGDDWDAQYDGMAEGWKMFLLNLQLHLSRFPGQLATPTLPSIYMEGDAATVWPALTSRLGVPSSPTVGQRVELSGGDDLALSGELVDVAPHRFSIVLDEPTPGTAFVAVEQMGESVSLSIWSYLYGPDGAATAARDEPRWHTWLTGFSEMLTGTNLGPDA